MHKKRKYNRHNVHKGATIFPMTGKRWSATFMYVVCPEKSVLIGWYEAPPNPETGENSGLLGRLTEQRLDICASRLGKHGYLQAELGALQKKCRERLSFQLCYPKVDNLKLFNVNKEEKKMGEIRKDRITPARNYLEKEKIIKEDLYEHMHQATQKALNDTIFEEEKKMTEYYVIDVEMIYADYKTKATECLQVRQTGNYFEIPFDGPDCSEYRLNRLYERLYDYVNETKEMFKIAFEKSDICSNSVLKITSPYAYITDGRNREILCKMLTYAVEHKEYPYPIGDAGLSKVCFYLRECNNRKIYEKVYSEGIDCFIQIDGKVVREGFYLNYWPDPTDIVGLEFKNGRLTHLVLADNPNCELPATPGNTPGALYPIYKHDKPFQHVDEVKSLLRDIFGKRVMWSNASYITYNTFSARHNSTTREKIWSYNEEGDMPNAILQLD